MKDMRLKKLMASFLFVVCLATNCCLALPEEKDSCDIEQSVYKQTKDDDTYDSEQFVGKQIAKDFGKFAGISFLSNLFFASRLYGHKINNIEGEIFVPDEKIRLDGSLLNRSKFSKDIDIEEVKFLDPEKVSDNKLVRELFPDGSPKPEDVKQGKLGLCYFFAVLSTVAEKNPELIKSNLVDNGDGSVTVKFFNPNTGEPLYVKVQKTIPKLSSNYRFTQNDCLWVNMYLKAFVASGFYSFSQFNNVKSYKKAEGGFMDLVIRMITGKDTKVKTTTSIRLSNKENLYDEFKGILSNGGYICCDFNPLGMINSIFGKTVSKGIVRTHAYSVEKVYRDENGQKWVVIRNPWGCYTAKYDSRGKIVEDVCQDNDGYSTLKWEDFFEVCGSVYHSVNTPFKRRNFQFANDVINTDFLVRTSELACFSGVTLPTLQLLVKYVGYCVERHNINEQIVGLRWSLDHIPEENKSINDRIKKLERAKKEYTFKNALLDVFS